MNGEMDFMILNNKVKGVQGTVDNIDTKIDSVATKENIQEIKTLIENSGGGDALESTSQEILNKISSVNSAVRKYGYDINKTTVLKSYSNSTTFSGSDGAAVCIKLFDFVAEKDGIVTIEFFVTGKNTKSHNVGYNVYENSRAAAQVAENTSISKPGDFLNNYSFSISLSSSSATKSYTTDIEVKQGYYYSVCFVVGAYSTAGTNTITNRSVKIYGVNS